MIFIIRVIFSVLSVALSLCLSLLWRRMRKIKFAFAYVLGIWWWKQFFDEVRRSNDERKMKTVVVVIFRPFSPLALSRSFCSTSYSFSNFALDQLVFQLFIIRRTLSIHSLSARGFLSQRREKKCTIICGKKVRKGRVYKRMFLNKKRQVR